MTRRVFVDGLSRSRLEGVFAFAPENVGDRRLPRVTRSAAEVPLWSDGDPAGLSGSGRKRPQGFPDRFLSLVPGEQSPQTDLHDAFGQNGLGHARGEERRSERRL
jgi:hypothetical protein